MAIWEFSAEYPQLDPAWGAFQVEDRDVNGTYHDPSEFWTTVPVAPKAAFLYYDINPLGGRAWRLNPSFVGGTPGLVGGPGAIASPVNYPYQVSQGGGLSTRARWYFGSNCTITGPVPELEIQDENGNWMQASGVETVGGEPWIVQANYPRPVPDSPYFQWRILTIPPGIGGAYPLYAPIQQNLTPPGGGGAIIVPSPP